MIKKIIITFFAVMIFLAPAAGAKDVPLEIALEWLKGESELPEEFRETPITVPLLKPVVKEAVRYEDSEAQINAISHVFRQYNKSLDNATANEYANIIKSTSEKFGEDPFVIAALIVIESKVRPNARSRGGDYGLMQVRWRVHRRKLTQKYPAIKTEKDMFKPLENITAGTDIFSSYRKSADGDIVRAMRAYSGGGSALWEKVRVVLSQIKNKYEELLL